MTFNFATHSDQTYEEKILGISLLKAGLRASMAHKAICLKIDHAIGKQIVELL